MGRRTAADMSRAVSNHRGRGGAHIGGPSRAVAYAQPAIRKEATMTLRPAMCSGVVAACAGFLTRPCCVLPAVLSFAGMGTAGLSNVVLAHRTALIFVSAALMGTSMWMN